MTVTTIPFEMNHKNGILKDGNQPARHHQPGGMESTSAVIAEQRYSVEIQ
jgi:hypothetical protein